MAAVVRYAAAAMLGSATLAAAQAPLEPLQGTFRETVNPSEPVSASAALGVVLASGPDVVNLRTLYIHLPRRMNGKITVEIAAADARYAGTASYEVKASAPDIVAITFPTRQNQFLGSYQEEMLAIAAYATGSSSGGAAERTFFPVSRKGETKPDPIYLVYLMGQDADIWYTPKDTPRPIRCNRVTGIAAVKFDTVCRMRSDAIDRNRGVVLRRIRGVDRLGELTIRF